MIDNAVGNPQCKFKDSNIKKHLQQKLSQGPETLSTGKRESAASRGNNSPMRQRILHILDIISVKRIFSHGQWFKFFITNTTSFEI